MVTLEPETIQKLVDAAVEATKEQVIAETKKQLVYQVEREVSAAVGKIVAAYVQEHAAPLLKTALEASDGAIVQAVQGAAAAVGREIEKAMVELAQARIKDSWGRRAIIGELFK